MALHANPACKFYIKKIRWEAIGPGWHLSGVDLGAPLDNAHYGSTLKSTNLSATRPRAGDARSKVNYCVHPSEHPQPPTRWGSLRLTPKYITNYNPHIVTRLAYLCTLKYSTHRIRYGQHNGQIIIIHKFLIWSHGRPGHGLVWEPPRYCTIPQNRNPGQARPEAGLTVYSKSFNNI